MKPILSDHAVVGSTFYKYFTIEAYYNIKQNNIYELPRQDNLNNIVTFLPFNFEKTVEYGFDFSTSFDVTERWSVYAVTSFYNIEDDTVFDGDR